MTAETSALDPLAAGPDDPFPSAPATASPDPRRWAALAVIAIAQLMVVLDATVVNIALPHAQAALGISNANRQWVVTGYSLTFGGLLLLGGRLADYLGRRRMFLIGLFGFAAASALGGAAVNGPMLLAARAVQGGFGALLAPAALSLLAVTFTDPHERARAFGVYGGIAGGGAALGLILGGVLTQYATWRWCLLVNTPIALVTAVFAVRLLTESRSQAATSYDVAGALSVTAGLASLVYGFTAADEYGWSAPATLVSLLAAVALLAGFVRIERRAAAPLLPLRIITERNRAGAYLTSLLLGVAMFGMFLFLTYYFQGSLHYSALRSGFAFLPFSAGIVLSAGVASQLVTRIGPRPLMVLGLLLAITGMALLTQVGPHTAWVSHVLPAEIILSLGMGFVFMPVSSTALYRVGAADAGVASATINATQQVGGALGTAALNTVAASATAGYLRAHGGHALAAALVHGYTTAFTVGTLLIVAGLVACVALIRAKAADLTAQGATGLPVG